MIDSNPVKRAVDMIRAIGQPTGEWCAFCEEKLAVSVSADGVGACEGCLPRAVFMLQGGNRAMRREAFRREALRNDGQPKFTTGRVRKNLMPA